MTKVDPFRYEQKKTADKQNGGNSESLLFKKGDKGDTSMRKKRKREDHKTKKGWRGKTISFGKPEENEAAATSPPNGTELIPGVRGRRGRFLLLTEAESIAARRKKIFQGWAACSLHPHKPLREERRATRGREGEIL